MIFLTRDKILMNFLLPSKVGKDPHLEKRACHQRRRVCQEIHTLKKYSISTNNSSSPVIRRGIFSLCKSLSNKRSQTLLRNLHQQWHLTKGLPLLQPPKHPNQSPKATSELTKSHHKSSHRNKKFYLRQENLKFQKSA